MVEIDAQPGIDGVALFTLRGESGGGVVGRVRLLESSLMAGIALNRQALKLANRFAFVAIGAVQPGVPANQRKAIFVLAHALQNNIPALYGMTLLAIGTHLATMNVGVAVSAVGTGIGEHRLGVALVAGDARMHSAQRISGRIVIELRYSPYRLPANRSMAVLAGDAQIAVRAAGYGRAARLRERQRGESACEQAHDCPEQLPSRKCRSVAQAPAHLVSNREALRVPSRMAP